MVIDDVLEVAGRLNLSHAQLPPTEVARIEARVRKEFGLAAKSGALWERLVGESWHSQDAWRIVGEFFGDEGLALLLDDWFGMTGVRLRSGADLGTVLAETPWSSFYACDAEVQAVLAINDHDVLIGCGAGRIFVRALRERA